MGKQQKPLKEFLQDQIDQTENNTKLPLSDFLKQKTEEAENNNTALLQANAGLYDSPLEGNKLKYDTLGEYDKNLVIGQDQNELRAQNQSNWDKLGNGLVRGVVGEGIIGSIKAISDIPDNLTAIFDRTGIIEEDFTNDFSKWLESLQEGIREETPIFTPESGKGFSPSSASWWANNMESIFSAATFILPTMGVAKFIGVGVKSINALGKVSKLENVLIGAKAEYLTKGIGATIYSNLAESMQDAIPLAAQKYQEALQEFAPLVVSGDITQEQAEAKAREIGANAGWEVYTGNLANIVLDLPSTFTLLKGFKNSRALVSKGNIGKALGMEIIPEGIQESINFISKEEATRSADIAIGKEKDDYSSFVDRIVNKYSHNPDMWTATFFGALGGGVFQGISAIKDKYTGQATEEKERYKEQQTQLAKLQGQRIAELGLQSNDEQLFNEGQDQILFANAYENAKIGTSQQFIEKLEKLKSLSEEEAKAEGIDKSTIQDKINKALEIEDLYNNTVAKYGESKEDIDFNKQIVQATYNKKHYTKEVAKLDNEIAQKQQEIAADVQTLTGKVSNLDLQYIPFLEEKLKSLEQQKAENLYKINNPVGTSYTARARNSERVELLEEANKQLDKDISNTKNEIKTTKKLSSSIDKELAEKKDLVEEVDLEQYPQYEEYRKLIDQRNKYKQAIAIADKSFKMATNPVGRAIQLAAEKGKKDAEIKDAEKEQKRQELFNNKKEELIAQADSGLLQDKDGNKVHANSIELTPENIGNYKPVKKEQVDIDSKKDTTATEIEALKVTGKPEEVTNKVKENIDKNVSKKNLTEQDEEITPSTIEELIGIEKGISDLPTPFKTASIDTRLSKKEYKNDEEKINFETMNHFHSFAESLTRDDLKDGKLKLKIVQNTKSTPLYTSEVPDAIIMQVVDKKGNLVLFEGKPVFTYFPVREKLVKLNQKYYVNKPSKFEEFKAKLPKFDTLKEAVDKNLKEGIDTYFNIVNFNSGQFIYKTESNAISVIIPEIANSKDVGTAYKKVSINLSKENEEKVDASGASVSIRKGTLWTDYKGKIVILNNRRVTENEAETVAKLIEEYRSGKTTLVINGEKINLKEAIQNIIFFGANPKNTSKFMIYLDDKNNLWYGDKKLTTSEEIKEALKDKYINANNDTIVNQKLKYTEVFTDENGLNTRVWNSYNEYLLSDRLPNNTSRDIKEIPFVSNIQNYGKPQIIGRYLIYDSTYHPHKVNPPIEVKEEESTDIASNDFTDFGEDDFLVIEGAGSILTLNNKGEFVSLVDKRDASKNTTSEKDVTEQIKKSIDSFKQDIANKGVSEVAKGLESKGLKVSIKKAKVVKQQEEIPANFSIAREESKVDIVSELASKRRGSKSKTSFRKPSLTENIYKKEDIIKAKEWLKSVLGEEAITDENFEVINGLIEEKNFGAFTEAGKILLSNVAEEGTIYHEAFHKAFNLYFNPKQRNRLLNDLRNRENYDTLYKEMSSKYPNETKEKVEEEILAEEFRTYVLVGKAEENTKSLFKKLLDFIKSLFNSTVPLEEIFERLSRGYYRNAPQYTYNTPTKSYRAFNINGEKFSEAFTKDVLDSITYFMFNNLFEGNLTYANLFNRKNTVNIAYKRSLEDFEIEIDNLIDISQEKGITQENLIEIRRRVNELEWIVENWDKILPYHYDYFKQFGITIKEDKIEKNEDGDSYDDRVDEVNEEERIKDTVFDKAAYESSSIESMPKNIKLLIATLTDGTVNSLGIPKLVDFHKTYAYLANQLSELSFVDMVEKLKTLNKPFVKDILDKIKADRKDLSTDDIKLQIEFKNQMSLTKLKFYLGYVDEEGKIVFGDSNQNRAEDKIAEVWKSSIRDSKHVKNVNGRLVITTLPDKKLNVYRWLEELGIKVSFEGKLEGKDLKDFNDSIIYIRRALEENINAEEVEDIFQLKDLGKRLNNLTKLEIKYSDDYIENQHLNSEGKTVYDITLPSFLTNLVAKIKQGKWNQIEHIDTIYNKRSLWTAKIKKGVTDIEVALLDGLVNTKEGEGQHTSNLSILDKISQEFNALLGNQEMSSILRIADKKSEYSVKGFGLSIPVSKFKKPLHEIEEVKDIFYGYFLDELERIQDHYFNDGYKNIETYSTNGGKWTIFDGILEMSKEKLEVIKQNKGEVPSQELEDLIKSEITSFLAKESESEYNFMGINGMFKVSGENYIGIDKEIQNKHAPNRSTKEVKNLVTAYTVNKIINHIEQIKLIYGDLAFFKYEKGDLFKRTPYITAAKQQAVNEEYFNNEFLDRISEFGIGDRKDNKHQDRPDLVGKIQTITFDDITVRSSYYDVYLEEIKKDLKAKGVSKKDIQTKAEEILKAYSEVNEADGQGYISLDEYREFLIRTNGWKDKHETLYRKIRKGGAINGEDVFYFMPLKAQYSAIQKDGVLAKPVFHKYSLMPLIPSLVKGSNLEKLSDYMTEKKIGYAIFKSADKIAPKVKANGQFNKLYNKDGEFSNDSNPVLETISYDNLGIQVEIAPKVKNNLIDGTQQRKLKWSDVFSGGKARDKKLEALYNEYCTVYDSLFEIEKEALIEELGLKESKDENDNVKYEQVDLTKLVETLRNEGINRNSPDNLIDGLQTEKQGDKIILKYPFDALPNRNKIENIIMSIASNRLIKYKQNGEAYIQGSIAGFESIGKRNFGESNRLKFYRKDENGNTLPAQLAIPLPVELLPLLNRYDNSLSEDEKIELLNQDLQLGNIDKSLISLVGYRIPCQGMNSIESFEVGFFLTRTAGTLCLVPTEMTAKAGSDFDVDKLSIFRPNVKLNKENTLELETEGKTGLQNRILTLSKEMIEHPSNFVKLITPNNTNTLKSVVKELRKINPKSDKTATDNIIPRNVINIGKQFQDGKGGVGISALHNTHHVLSQIANLIIDGELNLENNGTLSEVLDIDKNNIGEVLSEVINAFVDVAKDPFIRDLNLNTKTAGVYLTLVRLGVPFNKVALFMNQPIIKEYLTAKEFNNSTIVNVTDFYHKDYNKTGLKRGNEAIIENINRNYPTTGQMTKGHYVNIINDKDQLKALIKKADYPKDDFNQIQKRVLEDYIKYEELADKLRDVMSASNQDTKTPKDIVSLNDSIIKYDEVSVMPDVQNFDKLFNGEKNINLLGVFKKAQDATKSIATPLFITQTPIVTNLVFKIAKNIGVSSTEERQKLLKTIENDFINFLIQNKAEFNGKKFKEYSEELFRGNKTLAKKLLKIKERRYNRIPLELQDKLNNNIFIKELYPIISAKKSEVDIIKLFNKRMTTYDSNILTNSFNELYELHPNLADAITVLGLLQSGVATSAISFTDKIPFELYGKFIKPIISEMEINEGQVAGLSYDYFEYLFYSNNLKNKHVRSYVKELDKILNKGKEDLSEYGIKNKTIKSLGDWKYKNYDTANSIVLSDITPIQREEQEQEVEESDMLQVESNSTEKGIEELNAKMLGFFNSIGVDYKLVENLTDRNGNPINAIAKADLINKVVQAVEGKIKVDTLPEEAAHFFVEMLPDNHPLLLRMMDQIKDYPETQEVFEQYNDIYDGSYDKLIKEAIGKVIAKEIVGAFNSPQRNKTKQVRHWWSALWEYVKDLFRKGDKQQLNAFREAADRILSSQVIEWNPVNLPTSALKETSFKKDNLTFNVSRESQDKDFWNIEIFNKVKNIGISKKIYDDGTIKYVRHSDVDIYSQDFNDEGLLVSDANNIKIQNHYDSLSDKEYLAEVVTDNSKDIEMYQLDEMEMVETAEHKELFNKIKITLNRQIEVYKKRVESESEVKALDKLKELRDNLDNINILEAIDMFIDKSYRILVGDPDNPTSISAMGKKIGIIREYVAKDDFSNKTERDQHIRDLEEINEFNESLSILQDINEVLSIDGLTTGIKNSNLAKLAEAVSNNNLISKSYYNLSVPLIADYLFDFYNQKINEQLIKSGHENRIVTRKSLEAELRQSKGDIGMLESWLVASANMDDAIIGLFTKSINKQIFKAEQQDAKNADLLGEAFNKWVKATGVSTDNKEKLFDRFIEEGDHFVDGKPVKRLKFVSKYDMDRFWSAKEEEYNRIEALGLPEDIEMNTKSRWWKENTTNKKGEEIAPIAKYLSEKYKELEKDKPSLEFYNTMIDIYLSSQKGIPTANKLNSHGNYWLPALPKESKDYLLEKGKIKIIDEDKHSEMRSNLQTLEGKNLKKVPIFFSHYINPSEQSKDLTRSILSYTSEINKYKAFNEIQAHVNATLKIVEKTKPLQKDIKGNNIVDNLAQSIGIKNSFLREEENRRSKRMHTYVDQVFYGIEKKTEKVKNILHNPTLEKMPLVGRFFKEEINYGNLGDKLTGFTAINALAGDALQAFNNVTIGNITGFAEALGGRFYTSKDWWSANVEYFANIGSTLNDVGSTHKSLINKLVRDYGAIQGTFKDNTGNSISSSKLYNLLETDSIFFLQNAGEHQIQVTTFLAFLKAKKIKRKNGEEISLYDAYKESKGTELKEDFIFTNDDKFELREIIQASNKRNNGVYSKLDPLPMQQYTLGRMALVFRKFIPSTVRARFGGLSLDHQAGVVNQGYYRSFVNQLIKAHKERSISVMFDWQNMTDFQKEGVKRSMIDLITLATTGVLITALVSEGDDEEPTLVDNFLLYQAMRLQSDVLFYMPGIGFNDQFRVLNTPTAVAGTVLKTTKVFKQLFSYDTKTGELGIFEEYKRDSGLNKKGDNKLWSRIKRLIPVYNNIEESTTPEHAISVLEKIKN